MLSTRNMCIVKIVACCNNVSRANVKSFAVKKLILPYSMNNILLNLLAFDIHLNLYQILQNFLMIP